MLLHIESFFFYFLLLLFYIPVAKRLNITDHPNLRSSHTKVTVTGAGFIFPLAFLLSLLYTGTYVHYRATLTGLFLLTCISFLDDLRTIQKLPRMIIQFMAVGLILWQTGGLFDLTIWTLIPAFIFVVGIINAYNFMDGINGITVLYSITTVGTLFYLSMHGYSRLLPDQEVFFQLLISLVAFGFFNIRHKALLFCGDVGSITLAYIISLLIIQMMLMDDSGKWILLIGVYGLDAVATIILRLIRRENIGEPHRKHFYQVLTNEKGMTHLSVSLVYTFLQCLINYTLIVKTTSWVIGLYLIIIICYVISRIYVEGMVQLFKKNDIT